MKKSIKMFITGTVQGVFFRDFVKENAKKLGIRGYVRNLEDARLEAWFEGEGKNVMEMVEICKQGPKHASIRRVDVQEETFQDFKDFKVLTI
jgi:acylphosphatase